VQIAEVVDAILTETKISAPERDGLLRFIQDELADEITRIAADPDLPQTDLSERLANRGLLPMFGFPTRERLMYLQQPFNTQEVKSVGRDLSIAISEFAPGSEVVKDKRVYRSVGVASYRPQGHKLVPDPDPLGSKRAVGLCRACGAISPQVQANSISCTICGAPSPDYEQVDLSEPKGFRTDYSRGRPFDWEFDQGTRAGRARLGYGPTDSQRIVGVEVLRGKSDIYTLNEGVAGSGFGFAADPRGHGFVVPAAFEYPSSLAVTDNRMLGSITRTDVLVLRPAYETVPRSVRFSPTSTAVRAAWYSMAFMVRKAATIMLEVDQRELKVGVEPFVTDDGTLGGQIFLSDELENGAGYASRLGEAVMMQRLFTTIVGGNDGVLPPSHRVSPETCDSSCYDCLRDYWNRAYHPLLDWRLARDMAQLFVQQEFDVRQGWPDLGEQLCARFCRDLGFDMAAFGDLPGGVNGDISFIVAHPLWSPSSPPAELAQAMAAAGPNAKVTDFFELSRRPGRAYLEIIS
jgi:hypothetical protein